MLEESVSRYLDSINHLDKDFEAIIKSARELKVPIVSNAVAGFLKTLVMIKKPRRVCEIGTGFGISTLSIARYLEKDAHIVSCDLSINSCKFVQNEIERRNLSGSISVVNKGGIDFLKDLKENNEEFDFCFIDAVKSEYKDYLDLLLEIVKKGSILVFDNVLWKGEVAESSLSRKAVALREFNSYFMKLDKIEGSILSIGDGIALGIVK